ncbi:hypothetical protein BofuT4_uP087920.1 [Botrytis cinerea T4]|uniref:Uncharacterized protein n=1 Tax=Botryotinia fuckeliana (strain T4) TaxID=999810 RepID=G2YG31_BOTF4|nr:hypothetical protein BofuT4_uP087920.1 [Botrytis cinerea T4]
MQDGEQPKRAIKTANDITQTTQIIPSYAQHCQMRNDVVKCQTHADSNLVADTYRYGPSIHS